MFLKFASSICRVCLGPEGRISLFKNSGNDRKFISTTDLKITEDDGLPTSLCDRCSERLNVAYEFKKQSVSSNSHLRSFVSTINSKFALEVESLQSKYACSDTQGEESFLENQSNAVEKESTSLEIDIISDYQIVSENEKVKEDEVVSLDDSYKNEIDAETENKRLTCVEENNYESTENILERKSKNSVGYRRSTNVCRICFKSFANRTNLNRHLLTHSNLKPYECPVCHNVFTQNGSLKQHMLRHTGERPHICVDCGKGFTRRRLLTMHERIHTGEKPFHCKACNLNFTVKEGLRRHNIRTHSGKTGEVYTCSICQKKLHSKYTLRNHMQLHHKSSHKKKFGPQNLQLVLDESEHNEQETEQSSKNLHSEGMMRSIVDSIDIDDEFSCDECNFIFLSREELMQHCSLYHSDDMEI